MAAREHSAFRRFFFSTLGLDVVSRGLSALSLVLFVRSLSTPAFAYVLLLQTVGQFVGSALTGGVRTRYLREEAERVSRGLGSRSSFLDPLTAILALIGGLTALTVAVAELVGAGGTRALVASQESAHDASGARSAARPKDRV